MHLQARKGWQYCDVVNQWDYSDAINQWHYSDVINQWMVSDKFVDFRFFVKFHRSSPARIFSF